MSFIGTIMSFYLLQSGVCIHVGPFKVYSGKQFIAIKLYMSVSVSDGTF